MKVNPRDSQPLVYLQWVDAHTSDGWHSEEMVAKFVNEDCVCENIGWVIAEDPTAIVLCGRKLAWTHECQPDEDQYGLLQKIPTTWIRKKVTLSENFIGGCDGHTARNLGREDTDVQDRQCPCDNIVSVPEQEV